jgi:hypothetical protein
MAHAHKFRMTDLFEHIRELYLSYVNVQWKPKAADIIVTKHNPKRLDESNRQVIQSNKAHSGFITSCKRLRELRLMFWDRCYICPTKKTAEAMNIDEQFDIQVVLGCKELQKVYVLGIAQC